MPILAPRVHRVRMKLSIIDTRNGRVSRATPLIGCCLGLLLLNACTIRPYINQPLAEVPAGREHMLAQYAAGDRAPELLVFLALSGGGMRAAAMAYGVLQELADTRIQTSQGERRLLDEVDVVSSVSGGSFVSAYFGLYGDRLFIDFEQRFLRRPVQSDLAKGMVNPLNWGKEASPYYGRSDMAAEYYDRYIFDGRTFDDIYRRAGPLIIINSTDLDTGSRLGFIHPIFDLLCTDLNSYPVSRAVMASSAVPGAATPITLKNYADQCGNEPPQWLQRFLQEPDAILRRQPARGIANFADAQTKPWLHLADGGIADNLGLRPTYAIVDLESSSRTAFEVLGHRDVKRILIIAVNAAVVGSRDWAIEPKLPQLIQVLNGATKIQKDRITSDTIYIVRRSYQDWVAQVSTPQDRVHVDFAEVSFANLEDAADRAYFNKIPTTLELEEDQIDRLITVGRSLLRDAPEFRRFLAQESARTRPD